MPAEDKAKAVIAVVKAVLLTLFAILLVAFLLFQSARKYVAKMAQDANIKSVSAKGGVEFWEIKQKSLELVNQNAELRMKENPQPKSQDLKPNPVAADLLVRLQQSAPAPASDEFWVYVGEYNKQKQSFRNPPNFAVKSPPTVNSTITASTAVYERAVKPYKDPSGAWQLGAIKGVLAEGKKATVVEVAEIEGENQYDFNSWVKIKPQ